MSLTENPRFNRYIAAGGEASYAYTFPIYNENDIQVDRLRGTTVTTLILGGGNDYTVTGVGNPDGGTIVFTAPTVAGDIYAIFGINEYRSATYNQLGDFFAADVNTDIDKSIMIGQQNRRDISRSIRTPMVDPAVNLELPIVSERAGKYITFDEDGNIDLSSSIGIDTNQITSVDGDIVIWDGPNADKVKSADQAVRVPAGTTAQRPVPLAGMIRYNTTLAQIEGYDGGQWVNLLTTGTGAPISATYIVQQSDGVLTNEQAMADLVTGIVKNTTGTGVQSIAIEGIDYYEPGGTNVAIADGGTGASTATLARTNLGLEIGVNVQAYDETLQSLSALGTAANKMPYTTGVATWAETDITAAGRALLDDNNSAAQRTTLGLTIGTDVQAQSAKLTSIAGLATTGFLVADATTAASRVLTAGSGVAITNPSGATGNPTFSADINSLTADAAPDGAADYVMTYDASAATNKKVLLNNLPGGGGGGGGKVLQVVTATKTDTATTSSTNFTDILGLSVTLPSLQSSGSRVLILVTLTVGGGNAIPAIQILRGSTAVGIGDAASSRARVGTSQYVAGSALAANLGLTFVDSPATTASTTYKVQWRIVSSTAQLNRSGDDTDSSSYYRGISSITVMEIGA
ncbi:hypothetical protein [Candidatus Odyssella acanthamoebae]|uniref:hypothetical protein n=1 Tax=Candidatus Odyssella acanthamoebae TaxID=91604 RepID=UPI00068AE677|nr:hypothetical protein [Candidatus Paracaedibacter acanthamoebae]